MLIVFERETQIDFNNVPVSIYVIATKCNTNGNGEFFIETECSGMAAEATLRQLGFNNFSEIPETNTIMVRQNISQDPEHVDEEEDPEHVDEEEDPEHVDEEEVMDTSVEAIQGIPISYEELLGRASALAPSGQDGGVNIYLQKVNEFNRLWGNIIIMKRQIDNIMKTVKENEIVKTVTSDVEYLSEKCPIVESISLMRGEYLILIITTKEIVSAMQPKFGSRTIGRMQIIIDLRYIYSSSPPSTDFTKTVDIINLDRNPKSVGVYWACGHVNRANLEGQMTICYGGYFQQIFNAIASKNLPQLFDIIIRFIQNPNEEDSWGEKISLFPRGDK